MPAIPSSLRPGALAARASRLLERSLRRTRGVDRKVVTLEPAGKLRGRALYAYIIDPFLGPPDAPVPHSHTNYWESRAIGHILRDLGFRVDVTSWTNLSFSPAHRYDLLVDVRLLLERLGPDLGPDCLKVMHIETAHRDWHNPAQLRRLAELEARRGFRIRPQKLLEANRAIEAADCATILGNAFTMGTYAFAGKPLYPLPISQPVLYDFPAAKDFEACRNRFLWFGSAGLVHKGLDLVLEAFAGLPDHHLTVCGPVDRERDFERAFARELYATPNIETIGWTDIQSERFRALTARTLGLVYPSCSEGQNGGAVTCMHAGVIPIVSRETGVDLTPDRGIVLPDCSIASLRATIEEISARPAAELAAIARAAWSYARANHTRARFAERYRETMVEILETHAG